MCYVFVLPHEILSLTSHYPFRNGGFPKPSENTRLLIVPQVRVLEIVLSQLNGGFNSLDIVVTDSHPGDDIFQTEQLSNGIDTERAQSH